VTIVVWYNTHRAHVLFLLSGEYTTTRPRTMVMQRVTDNTRGGYPHCVKQKTSLSWPDSRSTRQTQIVACLGCFLTATIRINNEWHANQTEWTPHTIYIDWLFSYMRGGVRYISVTAASASFQEGSRKTTKFSVITVGVPAEIRSDHLPNTSQQLYCLICFPRLDPMSTVKVK
jgi:hypothetical protein